MAYRLTQLEQFPALAILDGINAACSQHGWNVNESAAIGHYRAMFVTPLVKGGAAVLSLGHPPKAKDRQNEMHSLGSTGWLDEVDGVGFRLIASKNPMIKGDKGHSALHAVKDRYSQVKRWGNPDATREQVWYYMGAFIVDDTRINSNQTILRLNTPPSPTESRPAGKEATLANHIVEALRKRKGHRFESLNQLKGWLHADGVKFTYADAPVALEMLVDQERLVWPPALSNKSRPGWLVEADTLLGDPGPGDSE